VKTVRIGDREVGEDAPVYIIAEAGSNHDRNLDQARRLIDVAAEAGADAVKFQTFLADRIVALIFDRPSTRTRVSFEAGVVELGGHPLVLRGDDRIRCGYITRVALDNDGELTVSLKLWPGSATAIAVRALTTMLVEEPPAPALTLSATPDEKACIIMPPRAFSAGRVLRSLASGPERRLRLTRLIQRGADFERAAFEEAAR